MTQPAEGVTRFDGQITLDILAIGLRSRPSSWSATTRPRTTHSSRSTLVSSCPPGSRSARAGSACSGSPVCSRCSSNPTADQSADPNQLELPWYGIQPGPSWYHAPPTVGVAELRKWKNQKGSLALGGGVTIGTVPDNGFTFAGKFLLGIILPGPILFIEGRANILKERASLRDDRCSAPCHPRRSGRHVPDRVGRPLRVRRRRALIEIGGGAEAFYFHSASDWHIYFGIDEPRESAVSAPRSSNICSRPTPTSWSTRRAATGAWIGYDARWVFGPLRWCWRRGSRAGRAELQAAPTSAEACGCTARSKSRYSASGFGLGADARIAPTSSTRCISWPSCRSASVCRGRLPDFDVSIELEWGPEPDPPLLPVPLKEVRSST